MQDSVVPPRRRGRLIALILIIAAAVASGTLFMLQDAQPPTDLRVAAEAAVAAGRLDDAVIGYQNLLQQNPKDLGARRRLGQLYLAEKQPLLALKELRRAYPLRAQHPDIDLDIARARIALGEHREALTSLGSYTGPRTGDVDALEATARAALGEFDEAREVLVKAATREPETASLYLATARLAMSEQDLEGAQTAVDQALALTPEDPGALILDGRIKLAAQHPAAAAKVFETALSHAKDDADALAGLAEALLTQRDVDAATPVVARLGKLAPQSVIARHLVGWLAYVREDWPAAAAALHDVLRVAPTHPSALLMAADSAFRQDKLARAEALLRTFVKHHEPYPPAQRLLGTVLLKQQRAREAIVVLAPIAAAGTSDAGLLALLGQAYFQAGEIANGEAALAQAQRLAPESMALKTQRAVGRLLGGEAQSGLADLEQLVADAPDHPAPRQALTYLQLLGGNRTDALASARALVALRPEDPIAHNLLGVAAAEAGEPALARAALGQALTLDAKFAPALSTLGMIELRAGNTAAGKAKLEAALAADQRYTPAVLALAALANAEGRGAEADALLERLVEADPQASEPRWVLALRYLRTGERERALRLADEALAIAPKHPRNRLLWSYVQLGAGRAEAAHAKLAELYAEEPDSPPTILLYADAARAAGLPDEAREAYRRATARAPLALEPWRGQFALALEARDVPAAEAAIAQLRKLNPEAPDADAAAAALAAQQGQPAAAVAALQAAFAKERSTLRLLQLADAERQRGEREAARALLTDWLTAHPDDLLARESLAMADLGDGRMQEARAGFERLLAAQTGHAVALNNLAWLYDEAGDPRALDYAQRAHQQLPESPEAADTLGWILVRQGQVQRGLKLIEQAVAGLGQDPTVHYHHAWALDAADEHAAALTSVEALLKKHAQFPARGDAERLREKLVKKKDG